MKTTRVLLLFAALFAVSARAQSPDSPPAAPAPAIAAADPAPNKTIYTPRLPTAAELTAAAAAQQVTIVRIEQTANNVTATYQAANGAVATVTYLPLAAANGNAPAVGVRSAPRVVYYDGYAPSYYYDPFYYYPPVSLRFGFGFRRWR